MTDTKYFNGFSKLKASKYGIKISGKLDKIIEALKECANEQGYVNLEIQKKKEADKYGNDHYVKVDTWEKQEKPF